MNPSFPKKAHVKSLFKESQGFLIKDPISAITAAQQKTKEENANNIQYNNTNNRRRQKN